MSEGGVIELLTIEEVAERLRVSVPTVRWLRQEGRFAPAIRVGRRLVWDARDVAAWLKAHRESQKVALWEFSVTRSRSGAVRYRARVKSHGRYVATRVFERKADAVAWEQDQRRRLRLGEWIDPRRGQVPLSVVAVPWMDSRGSVKRRTRESDEAAWRNYIQPRFGNWPVASITSAEVSSWVGSLVARGLAPSTATRALATLRSILGFAVADARVQHNVAAAAQKPTRGRARREGAGAHL